MPMTDISGTTLDISSAAALVVDIGKINRASDGTAPFAGQTVTLSLSHDISLADLAADLPELNSAANVVIVGNGHTLDGGGVHRGLMVFGGNVSVSGLTIADTLARGGDGGGNSLATGGGGAGLGGGLFVANGGTVTLSGVNFVNDQAVGGNGGDPSQSSHAGGGGGGMGGTGGAANQAGGGGGGIGNLASGGAGGWTHGFGSPGGTGIAAGQRAAGSGGTDTYITRFQWFIFYAAFPESIEGGKGGAQGGGGGGGGGSNHELLASAGGGGGQTQGGSAPGTPPEQSETFRISVPGPFSFVGGPFFSAFDELSGYILTVVIGTITGELGLIFERFGLVNGLKYIATDLTEEAATLANDLSDAKLLEQFETASLALDAGNPAAMVKFMLKEGLKVSAKSLAINYGVLNRFGNVGAKLLYHQLRGIADGNHTTALGATHPTIAYSGRDAPPTGGVGGFGGGGGGGGGAGGAGGFGGGGGGGGAGGQLTADGPSYRFRGGQGGFGGGGGGGGLSAAGGYGGFGGGAGGFGGFYDATSKLYYQAYGGGGGGLGAGGAVFVQQGGKLTIAGSDGFSGNSVQGGYGQVGAYDGGAYGAGLFLQGNQSVTLAPALGGVISIGGIADEQGSDAADSSNRGTLVIDGAGLVKLGGTNTYAGSTVVRNGTLELVAGGIITQSSVTIGAGGVLILDTGSNFTGTLDLSGYDPHATLGLLINPGAVFSGTFNLPANFAFALNFTPPIDLFQAGAQLLEVVLRSQNNGVTAYDLSAVYDSQTSFGVRSYADIITGLRWAATHGNNSIAASIDQGVTTSTGTIDETAFAAGSVLKIIGQGSTLGDGLLVLSSRVTTSLGSADGISGGTISAVSPLTMAGAIQGTGALSVSGHVTLTGTNTFTGGLSLGLVVLASASPPVPASTTLELGSALAAGQGAIAIGDGAILRVDGTLLLSNHISDFGLSSVLDLPDISATAGNIASGADGALLIPLAGGGTGTLWVGGNLPARTAFGLRDDLHGGTELIRLQQNFVTVSQDGVAQAFAALSAGGSLSTPGATGTLAETPSSQGPIYLTATQAITPADRAEIFIDAPLGIISGNGLDVGAATGRVTLRTGAVFERIVFDADGVPHEDTSSTAPLLTVEAGATVVLAGATLALTPNAGRISVLGTLLAEVGTINAALDVAGGSFIADPVRGQTLVVAGALSQPLQVGGASLPGGGLVVFGGSLTGGGGAHVSVATTLEITAGASLSSGAIVLDAAAGAVLRLDGSPHAGNPIDFASGNGTIDLAAYASLGTMRLTVAGGTLAVPTASGTVTLAVQGLADGTAIEVAPDGTGGTILMQAAQTATVATTDQLLGAARAFAAMPAIAGLTYTVTLAPAGGTLELTGDFQPFTAPAGVAFSLTDRPSAPVVLDVAQGVSAAVAGNNSFTGGVRLDGQASLELLDSGAAGSGTIGLTGPGNTLRIDGTMLPGNLVTGIVAGETIDLAGLALPASGIIYAGLVGSLSVAGLSGAMALSGIAAGSAFAATNDGHGGTALTTLFVQQTIIVANEADLAAAIKTANSLQGVGQSLTIRFADSVSTLALATDLPLISLASGVTLTIDGAGKILDGSNVARGLLVYAGSVVVQNLTIADAVAQGGAGGDGRSAGGGGGGLGGGLFVGSAANVTLLNTAIRDNRAVGGAGGVHVAASAGAGGGGGMGGSGGDAYSTISGGGGGLGNTATGGSGFTGSGLGTYGLSGAYGFGGAGIAYGMNGGGGIGGNRLLHQPLGMGGVYGGGGTAGIASAGGGIGGGTAQVNILNADYRRVVSWYIPGARAIPGRPVEGTITIPLTSYNATAVPTLPPGAVAYQSVIMNFGQTQPQLAVAGNGGWGGGGGGGAGLQAYNVPAVYTNGGAGGFGGGGGGGVWYGGNGGFGGGGGASAYMGWPTIRTSNGSWHGGYGGFGAGSAARWSNHYGQTAPSNAYQGGGGLGAGGGVFVQSGGSLTVAGGVGFASNAVAGGAGAYAGSALGSGIFGQGTVTVTLTPALATVSTIADDIADMGGNSGGALALVASGAGLTRLSGTLSYVGSTTVQAGTLEITGDASALGGAMIVRQGATLVLSGTGTQFAAPIADAGALVIRASATAAAITSAISGTGSVVVDGSVSATVRLSGTAGWTGGSTIGAGGTLVLAGGFAGLGGTIEDSGALVLQNADTLSAPVVGAGSIIAASKGTVSLGAANAVTGGVTVASGVLSLQAAGAVGTGPVTFAAGAQGTLTLGAAALTVAAPGTLDFATSIAGFAPGDVIDLAIAGASALATLGANNILTVSAGATRVTLHLDAGFNPGTANFLARSDGAGGIAVALVPTQRSATIASAADQRNLLAAMSVGGSLQVPNEVNLVTVLPGATASGMTDLVNLPAGDTLVLSSVAGATLPDGLDLAAGNVQVSRLGIGSPLRVRAGAQVSFGNGIAVQAALAIDAGAAPVFAPDAGQTDTISGGLTGAGSLVVDGAGTLALSGTSSLSGDIVLDGGVLLVRGAQAAGNGAIRFAAGHTATLTVTPASTPGNVIAGFLPGDVIDIAGFTATGLSVGANNLVSLTGASGTVRLQLDPTLGTGAYAFVASQSGADTLLTLHPRALSVDTPTAFNAAIAQIDAGGIVWPGGLIAGITLSANLTGANAVNGPLNPLVLPSGEVLLLAGNGGTIEGTGTAPGLVLQSGSFFVSNLTLKGFGATALSVGAGVNLTATALNIAGPGGVQLGNGATLAFTPGTGETDRIAAGIADPRGQGSGTGTGRVMLNGPGRLVLAASNLLAGGISIAQGTLELAALGAAGGGGVAFTGDGVLVIDPGAGSGSVSGLSLGHGTIDFAGVTPDLLSVSLSGGTEVVGGVTISGITNLAISSDHAGGSLVRAPVTSFVVSDAASLAATLTAIDTGGDDAAPNTAYSIGFSTQALALTTALPAVRLMAGSSLAIYGGWMTIDGGGTVGGLQLIAGDLAVSGLTLAHLSSAGDGGGLAVTGPGRLSLSNVAFVGDASSGSGGGLALSGGGSVSVSGISFAANSGGTGDDLALGAGETLTLSGGILSAGASGTAVLLGDGAVLGLAPATGNAVTVGGGIAGTGQVTVGAGAVTLLADGAFTGGIAVTGTLDLASAQAAGTGTITLADGALLRIEPGLVVSNTIAGLTGGATIDEVGMAGASLSVSDTTLTLSTALRSVSLTLAETIDPATVLLTDVGGDELVSYIPRTLAAFPYAYRPSDYSYDFGTVLAGGTQSLPATKAYYIDNVGGETLVVSTSGLTGPFSAPATLTIAPHSEALLPVGFAPGSDGAFSAAGTITLASVAQGRLPVTVGTLSLSAAGTVYAAAQFGVSATSVDLGTTRIGGVASTGTIVLSNGTLADPYQDWLDFEVGDWIRRGSSSPADYWNAPWNALRIDSTVDSGTLHGGDTQNIVVTLNPVIAGVFASSVPVTATDRFVNQPLIGQTLTATGTVYAPAAPTLPTRLDFGIAHVGDVTNRTLTVANTATGALTDVLLTSLVSLSAPFTSAGSFGTLAAGANGAVTLTLVGTTAGTVAGTAALGFISHDPALSDLALTPGTVQLSGTIDNYATAAISAVSGAGVFVGTNGTYTLNFGTLVGSATETLSLANLAIGQADLLGARVTISGGAGFSNGGFDGIGGIGAGQADSGLTITAGLGTGGTITETLVITPTGSNGSGYLGTLAPITVTVTAVVPTQDFDVSDFASLNTVLENIDQGGALSAPGTAYRINLVSVPGGTLQFSGMLAAINLASGSSVTFVGNGTTLDGNGQDGLFVTGGTVALQNLTLANMTARGGDAVGNGGGGGGAGLGGGLFVGAGASVSLQAVSFSGDQALGGSGAETFKYGRSGGGLNGRTAGGAGVSGNRDTLPGAPQAGFGSGGGGAYYGFAGAGGFGGGGGGGSHGGGAGLGGYGTSRGSYSIGAGDGGGGLGAGADIFVQEGGTVTLESGTLQSGTVGGTGLLPDQQGLGPTVFLQGTQTVALAPTAGDVVSIAGGIADQRGNGGVASLLITGSGTVSLTADSTYTGGTEVRGRLELGAAAAAGTGAITLDASGILAVALGINPANIVSGFGAGRTIDAEGLAGATAIVSGNSLIVTGTAGTLSLLLAGPTLSSYGLVVGSDRHGGTAITYAPAPEVMVTPLVTDTIDLGALRLGGTAQKSVLIQNPLLQGGDSLTAQFGALSLGLAGDGGALTLGPGTQGTLALSVTARAEGVLSGTAGLTLTSFNPSADPTPIAATPVAVTGTVYALATPSLPTTIDLGSGRIGAGLSGSIRVGDGGVDPWREALVYAATTQNGGALSIASGAVGTVAAGGSASVGVTLAASQSGTVVASATLALTSSGVGTSGLGDTALSGGTVNVSGTLYASAIAVPSSGTLDFGIVHRGDSATQLLTVANSATGSFTDVLEGTLGALPQGFIAGAARVVDVAAGQSGTLSVGLDTSSAGSFGGTGTLALASHDGALADLALQGASVAFSGTVDAYATLAVGVSGGYALNSQGNLLTIDLGNVGARQDIGLSILNAAAGQADLLSGSFDFVGATGFAARGLDGFALAASQADSAVTLSLAPLLGGVQTGTLVVHATGSNASGYNVALGDTTIVVTGTVTSGIYAGPTPIASGDDLGAAIAAFDIGGALSAPNTAYTITLASGSDLALTADLPAVNLQTGSTLTIVGNGATIDGGNAHQGLVDFQGGLVLNDLTIANAVARGMDGADGSPSGNFSRITGLGLFPPALGGGGGAGLGGALFVASGGQVQLNRVSFSGNSAIGGNGGGTRGSGAARYGAGGKIGGSAGQVLGGGGFGTGSTGLSGAAGFGGGGGGGYGSLIPSPGAGFGGGRGSTANAVYSFRGYGGYTYYTGNDGGGGGGLGAGADIFVQAGGGLSIGAGTLNAGAVAGGLGQMGGGNGLGLGGTAFLQGNGVVTLDPPAGTSLTLTGDIADTAGSSTLVMNGAGTLVLAGSASYAVALEINSGTVLITGDSSGFTGRITNNGTLILQETPRGNVTVSGGAALHDGDAIRVTVPDGTLYSPGGGWSADVSLTGSETMAQVAVALQDALNSGWYALIPASAFLGPLFHVTYDTTSAQFTIQEPSDVFAGPLLLADHPIALANLTGTPLQALGLPALITAPTTSAFHYPLAPSDALLINGVSVTVGGLGTLGDLAAAIGAAGIAGVSATLNTATGDLAIASASGGLFLYDAQGTPLETLGFGAGQQAAPLPAKLDGSGVVIIADGVGSEQVLSGDAGWTGTTLVRAGNTLLLNGAGAEIGGTIINNGAVVFGQTNPGHFTGQISGSGTIIVRSSVSMLGASTGGGGTEIDAGGVLSIGSDAGVGAAGTALTLTQGGTLSFAAGFTLSHPVIVSGDPTFDVASGNTVTLSAVIADGGTPGDVVLTGGGKLILAAANSYSGGTSLQAGTLELAAGGTAGTGAITFAGTATLQVDAAATAPTTIDLGGLAATATLIWRAGAGLLSGVTLDNFTQDGRLVLPDTAIGDGTAIYDSSAGTLAVTDSIGGNFSVRLADSGGIDPTHAAWQVTGDGTNLVIMNDLACFLRGTRIATPDGARAVEALQIGDLVCLAEGGVQPIRWIGRRGYLPSAMRPARRRDVMPIRFLPGSLGPDRPARDLFVSPEHMMAVDGVLVPAHLLVNDATVLRCDRFSAVQYFHLDLGDHHLILAEGAPTESYRDTGNRNMFANVLEYRDLGYALDTVPPEPCLPMVTEGAALACARRKIAVWAEDVGCAITDDPGLHLVADGAVLLQTRGDGEVIRFTVPEGARQIWIHSRSAPARDPTQVDIRRLGVAIANIELHDAAGNHQVIGPADEALGIGFHADEGTHRWTDGKGRIPLAAVAAMRGCFTVSLRLVGTVPYLQPMDACDEALQRAVVLSAPMAQSLRR